MGIETPVSPEIIGKNIPLDMYTPPSQQISISEHALERYFDCHRQDKEIEEIADTNLYIKNLTGDQFLPYVRKCLNSGDIEVQIQVVHTLWNFTKKQRLDLMNQIKVIIEEAFEGDDIKTQKKAVKLIGYTLETDQKALIEKALESDDIEVQKTAAEMISNAPETDRKALIEKAFKSDDIEVQKTAAGIILTVHASEQFSLRNKVKVIIEEAFESDDIEVQKTAAQMISSAPETDQRALIVKALKLNKEISNFMVRPPLYNKSSLNNKTLGREKFDKEGSETTLIGGPLKGKTIIRSIKPEAFLAWKEIYENYKLWQQAEFDYVPIEPILSYSLRRNGLVDVFSGVLDLNLEQWEGISTLFNYELEKQRVKIIDVFKSHGLSHGHPHNRNFVLSFYRNENGTIDLNKTPRLYAIDFDHTTLNGIKNNFSY